MCLEILEVSGKKIPSLSVLNRGRINRIFVSKPNFAEQINKGICFALCALPRGAVGMHNTALTVHEGALSLLQKLCSNLELCMVQLKT